MRRRSATACHDCGAKQGELHKAGCDAVICTICGEQLMCCGHFPKGNSINTGSMYFELAVVCEINGLFTKAVVDGEIQPGLPRMHWEKCARDDPEATYDYNAASSLYARAVKVVRERMGHGLKGR